MSTPLYHKKKEYVDKKGKKKTKIDESAAPVVYAKLIYSEKTKKILSLFKTKGKKSVNPFNYLNQYCYVKMALIFEGIYVTIKESDDDDESENEEQSEDVNIEDLIISEEVEEWEKGYYWK